MPSMEIVVVTPDKAKVWLESNENNRKLRESVVRTYARDMIAGNWHVTGESIKFNGTALIDPSLVADGDD